MNFNQLEQFCVIAEYENISDAAKKLFITQPALSLSLKKIEEEVGCRLFNRSGNHVYMNENGRIFRDFARKALDSQKDCLRKIGAKTEKKRISIYSNYEVFNRFIVPNLILFLCDYHIIQKKIPDDKVSGALQSGDLDLAVSYIDYSSVPGLMSVPIIDDLCCISIPRSNPLSEKTEGIYFRECDGQSFLRNTKAYYSTGSLIDNFFKTSKNAQIAFDGDDNILFELMHSSDALVSLSQLYTYFDRSYTNRVTVPLLDEGAHQTIYLIFRESDKKHAEKILHYLQDNHSDILIKQ